MTKETTEETDEKNLDDYPKMIRMNEGRAKNMELLREEWKPLNPEEVLLKPDNFHSENEKQDKSKKNKTPN